MRDVTGNAEREARSLTRTMLAMEFPHLTTEQLDWLWETFRGARGGINDEIRKAAKDARTMPLIDGGAK